MFEKGAKHPIAYTIAPALIAMVLMAVATSARAGNSFAPTGSMSSAHAEGAGDVVKNFLSSEDGFVVISGGYATSSLVATHAAVIYNPKTGQFSDIAGGLNLARGDHTETTIPLRPFMADGAIFAIGGFGGVQGASTLDSVEKYNPRINGSGGTFTLLTGSNQKLATGRAYHTATRLTHHQDDFNHIMIVAGVDTNGNVLSSVELFDAPRNEFESFEPSLNQARYAHAAASLKNGDVLITGGCTDLICDSVTNTAEIYDRDEGKFVFTKGPMKVERETQTETLLPDGTVLIAGGLNQPGLSLNTAEIYDPHSGKFRFTTDMDGNQTFMNQPRVGHSATLLRNGLVLIAGGANFAVKNSQIFDDGELYNPATGEFQEITGSAMSDPRFAHNGALFVTTSLPDGRVLVAGGYDAFFIPTATADIYTP